MSTDDYKTSLLLPLTEYFKTVLSVCSKRFASLTGQENFASSAHSSSPAGSELELLKQEILTEMKRELHLVKQEIIDGESVVGTLQTWWHLWH